MICIMSYGSWFRPKFLGLHIDILSVIITIIYVFVHPYVFEVFYVIEEVNWKTRLHASSKNAQLSFVYAVAQVILSFLECRR